MRSTGKAVVGVLVAFFVALAGLAAFRIEDRVVSSAESTVQTLWVPAPQEGQVVEIDPLTGDVMTRIDVADDAASLDVGQRDDDVIVIDRTDGVVSVIDPWLQSVVRTFEIDTRIAEFDIATDSVAIATLNDVRVIGPEARTILSSPRLERPFDIAAVGGGAAVVAEGQRVEISPNGVIDRSAQTADRLVRVGETVVVIDGLEILDSAGQSVGCLPDIPAERAPITGDASGVIVVVGERSVAVADITTGRCGEVVLPVDGDGGGLGPPVIAGGHVYVPETDTGTVHVIDTAALEVSASHLVTSGASELRLVQHGDLVAVFDQGSSFAALVEPTVVGQVIDTSESAAGFEAVLGDEGSVLLDAADVEDAQPVDAAFDSAVLAAELRNNEQNEPDEQSEPPDDVVDDSQDLAANFAFSASTVAVGEPVQFVDESAGTPVAWFWDFGDGTSAVGPEAQKSWDEPGTYPVTLTVAVGAIEDSVSVAIIVVPADTALPPNADFEVSSRVVEVGTAVSFTDRSAGGPISWQWNFGDGTTASGPTVEKAWASPGIYTVSLTVGNAQGTDSAELTVEVVAGLEPPEIAAQVIADLLEAGQAIGFTAESLTDAATIAWDFGDGTTAIGTDVNHVYAAPGEYIVRVTGTNDAGEDVVELTVVIEPATLVPIARIGAIPALIEAGDVVSLMSQSLNSPETYSWSFGDGGTAEGETVTHSWNTPGTYVLALTVENLAGSDTQTLTVEVVEQLPPPLAAIGLFDPSPWVGTLVVFEDASSGATGYLWDFGDGVVSSAVNPLHSFTTPGPKTVTLTVSNRNGTDSATVTVTPRLQPVANFTVSPASLTAGDLVTFTDASANASTWAWDFGDGTTSVLQNPTHTYATAGEYLVTLTVATDVGDVSTFATAVTVDPPPPLPAFGASPATGTSLVATTFDAAPGPGSGPITSYEIDFGDGSPTESNASGDFSHTYATAGTYIVQVRATGPLVTSDWVSAPYTVNNPPAPDVSISAPGTATIDVGVSLSSVTNGGSGPITGWTWNITKVGGGAAPGPFTGEVVGVTFTSTGTYQIQLQAIGPFATATVNTTITVVLPPPPTVNSVGATPNPVANGAVVSFSADTSASVVTWEWDFENDGSYVDLGANSANWIHTFNTTGTKTVQLRVFDSYGQQAGGSVTVTVIELPDPTPIVVAPSTTVVEGTVVDLSSSDTNGLTGLTWTWVLSHPVAADVVISGIDTVAIQNTFVDVGVWTVTVTAQDGFGNSSSEATSITVTPAPPAGP